ncbi:hypothetical protein [Marinobacter sp.]|uniref:hypothetical protein n=1 Tax=Marinobacter sp. TaxID=50741 RepID=UPI003A8F812B
MKKFDPNRHRPGHLTGACIIALGHQATGMLASDDELANELLAAGEKTGDQRRLPVGRIPKPARQQFRDIANIGGRQGITAACFLWIHQEYRWALDIAGWLRTPAKAKAQPAVRFPY